MKTTIPSVLEVAEYFDAMLELIPENFYFQQEGDSDQWKNKFAKNTKKSKQLPSYKQSKRAEAREQKKEKFDTAEKPSMKRKLQSQQKAKSAKKTDGSQPKRSRTSHGALLPPTERADSLEALRERLAMKIQLLRTGRSNQNRPRPRNFDAKPRSTKKARKSDNSSDDGAASDSSGNGSSNTTTSTDVDQIDFNSFTFADGSKRDDFARGTGSASGERLANRKKPNLRKLVQKADEKAKRIRALKESGEAPEIVAQEAWNTALLKAKGQKPADDVKYLKKKLKAQEKKKAKSAKEWKARNKAVAKSMADKQAQRAYNIANRKVPKADRINPITGEALVQPKPSTSTEGEGRGGGQSRPGFEGRARGFLNKPSAGRKGNQKKSKK